MTVTTLQRTTIACGALDVAYVAWIALGTLSGIGAAGLWQSTVAFGLPYPALQIAGMLVPYIAILICGIALLLQRTSLAWLNYVLFPVRILVAAPTLFPLFVGMAASGVPFHPSIPITILVVTEALRVLLVHRWSRHVSAAAEVAGAAA